jgi:pantetheine-phosphate adenylyltransferase
VTTTAICPGSFDPLTLGHLDIIERAAQMFDALTVAVVSNPSKQPLFDVVERVRLIEEVLRPLPGLDVEVISFDGLLVDLCRARGVDVIVKGLRAVNDFELEQQMAQMNRRIGAVETLFLATAPEHSHLSSSLVREIARLGGPLAGTVPDAVATALRARFGSTA